MKTRWIYGWIITAALLLLIFNLSVTATTTPKSKRATLYEKYRSIADDMEDAYNDGDLNRVIKLYEENCRKNQTAQPGEEKKKFRRLKKELRAGIYKWLALAYIELDRPGLAEVFLKKLLVIRHDEDIGQYWLPLRKLARDKYDVLPRWQVGVILGANFTDIHLLEPYSVFQSIVDGGSDYGKTYGFHLNHSRGSQVGLTVQYALEKNLLLCVRPTVGSLQFQYKTGLQWGDSDITAEMTHNQRIKYIGAPVYLKYLFYNGKWQAYAQAGGFFRFNTAAYKSIDTVIKETGGKFEEKIKEISILNQIVRSNFGFMLGASVSFGSPLAGVHLELEVNYKHAFGNIVNRKNRYENTDLLFRYYDVFDDIKIRNWEVSLNVLLPVSFKAFRK